MNASKKFLVVPACEVGRGGGHLFRSASLVESLRAIGAKAWLYSPTPVSTLIPDDFWFSGDPASVPDWFLIALDLFRTQKKEAERWAALAPLIGIDEGLSRNSFDFLLDLLPFPGKENPNCCAPSLLPLPKKRRAAFIKIAFGKAYFIKAAFDKEAEPGVFKVLVSFGAEDPAGLTLKAAEWLTLLQNKNNFVKDYNKSDIAITAVLGPLRKNNSADRDVLERQGITVIDQSAPDAMFNFKESLVQYDLLVTHFGLSAFEALYARIPVLLLNPGSYHERLAVYARLPTIGAVKRHFRAGIAAVYKTISLQSAEASRRWGLEEDTRQTLAEFLLNAVPKVYRSCPLCGAASGAKSRIAGRFSERTYRLCSCGAFLMNRLTPPPVEYNRNYFFDDYKKQYGKTYLEDFPQLKLAAERRLNVIKTLYQSKVQKNDSNSSPRLLDIGCAYGPFLAAARDNGFNAIGLDPAPEAVAYIRESLGITAVQGAFPESAGKLERINGSPEQYDVITLWYVIEHFEQPDTALACINALLKTGGVLAFSTPSGAGISRRKDLHAFLEHSPADHWTIWNPRRSAAVLKRYGFTLKKRVITGHHPERFPGMSGLSNIRLFKFLALGISRIFGMGDTFEAYAVKTSALKDRVVKNGAGGGHA